MDTPIITQYYKEHDPMKRKELLEQSIAAGECPEENQIRKELWEIRYAEPSKVDKENRADGFLSLWMDRSYNTTLCGIVSISKDKAKQKIQKDIYETAIHLPMSIKMEEELSLITRAAREVYELYFPGEGGI